MKMDNCLLTLVFGLSVLSVLSDSKDQCDEYAEEGQNFTVPLNHKLQGSETLKWRRGDSIIFYQKGKRIVTLAPEGVEVYQNGSLKLTNLKKVEEAVRYTSEVHDTNGKAAGGMTSINLCILDSFSEPKVEIKCSKTSPTKVTFTCNVDKAKDVTFTWLKDKSNVETEEKKDKPHILTQTAEDVEGKLFKCKVSNLASSKTSKAVQHECSSPKLFGLDFWIMVGILGGGGGLVLLLIIVVIVCCVRARKKRSMKVKDEEELCLVWTNSEQQHHHKHNHPPGHHYHHYQQQPVDHTSPHQYHHKQHRDPRSKLPDIPNVRAAQVPRPTDNVDDN